MTPEVGILSVPKVYIILTVHNTQIDTVALVEGVLCIPGVYIILTRITQHTDRYNGPNGKYTMCTSSMHYTDSRVHNTLKNSATPGKCIVCVPGVCIMRTRTLHTDRYNGSRGRYSMYIILTDMLLLVSAF